ncbi:MAG: HAD family hydrolase [Rhizobiaceae bacterium]|nr:HAD family hydrolase [Rhizobiaceae bacterium]
MVINISERPSLVIFDCDGVLVDTERMANAFMARVISQKGYSITGPQCQKRFVGLSLPSVRAKLLAEDGIDLGDDFASTVYDQLPNVFSKGVDPIPFVETAVEALRTAHIPWCVASSGKHEKMHMTLGSSGLLPLFRDVLFSGYEVERGKPHPDLFLHAANKMGHTPQSCVVIEDSLYGVQAAVSAGMRVLAYCGDEASDQDKLKNAGGEIFDDMRTLPALIGL